MVKDIKTKGVIKDIKVVDKKKNLDYFEKKNDINTKQSIRNDDHSHQQMTPKKNAVDKIIHTGKTAVINAGIKNRQVMKSKIRIKEKRKAKSRNDIVQKDISMKSKNASHHSQLKIKQSLPHQNVDSHDYNKRMKLHMIGKHKNKVKQAKETTSRINAGSRTSVQFFKGTYGVVKKVVSSVNNIITMGTDLIILLVIILFIGVFSALSEDSSVETSSLYVNENVLAYTETIEKYAKEYEMDDYVALIQAVMMQESGGKGNDPMQSSECSFNEKYPKKHNGITDPEYSIKVGIQYLAECLKRASVKDSSDMENISLALQGYNYGNGYIQWAIDHFGGYTRANAKVFSDEMKSKLQVDVYGDPDYVSHVLRYYHIGSNGIVAVAKSQIGVAGGSKYWRWYGFKSRVSWCACFVSWCANESGDLNKTIPRFSGVYDGMMWFKNRDKWKNKNYTAKSGDLIFFDWDVNDLPDHVGIVEKVKDGKIYTIEGNSKDEVRVKSYSINYNSILGYGIREDIVANI